MKPFARAVGQARGEWFLRVVVKEPEGNEGKGKIELKHARQGMSCTASAGERDEILEVGSEASEDDGRDDEACAPEGKCGGCVGEGKGHYKNYDGLRAGWSLSGIRKDTAIWTMYRNLMSQYLQNISNGWE